MTKEEIAAALLTIGNALIQAAEEIARYGEPHTDENNPAATEEKKADAPEEETNTLPKEEKKKIRLEDVRAVLSEISRSGHTAEMKALLAKHGAKKLSDIRPEDYEQLLAEAEEVKNA